MRARNAPGWRTGLLAVLTVLIFALQPRVAAATVEVQAVRVDGTQGSVRVVLTTSAVPEFTIFQLSAPDRLVIDIADGQWSAATAPSGTLTGPIRTIRHGQFTETTLRIVLDLNQPVTVGDVVVLPPTAADGFRLAFGLLATGQPHITAEASTTHVAVSVPDDVLATWGGAIPIPVRRPNTPDGTRATVVIDPGHGGRDPGAIGIGGAFEKTIALAVSLRLRDLLTERGHYRVLMTRADDQFVALEDRVAVARDAGADVFLSIHADSIGDPSLRGASVYTLSQRASDRQAARLAQRENRALLLGPGNAAPQDDQTASILIDLAQRHTNGRSAQLGDMLVEALGARTGLLGNAHRQAGFVVLTAPDVPSALVELGFLSNLDDGQELARAEHQAALAEALAEAVTQFIDGPGTDLALVEARDNAANAVVIEVEN